MKQEILIRAALEQIASEGWTLRTLSKAEEAKGWDKGTYQAYFPAGLSDFKKAFAAYIDNGMHAAIKKQRNFSPLKVREKIFTCVMARLHVMAAHRAAVQRLLAHNMMPWNKPQALNALAQACDSMWRLAGDKSHDMNYYSKRALLMGVYAKTIACFVNDESQDFSDTQNYLKQQIENVLRFGQTIATVAKRFAA